MPGPRIISPVDALGLAILTAVFAAATILEDLPLTARNLLARLFAWAGGWLCALLFMFAMALWRNHQLRRRHDEPPRG